MGIRFGLVVLRNDDGSWFGIDVERGVKIGEGRAELDGVPGTTEDHEPVARILSEVKNSGPHR